MRLVHEVTIQPMVHVGKTLIFTRVSVETPSLVPRPRSPVALLMVLDHAWEHSVRFAVSNERRTGGNLTTTKMVETGKGSSGLELVETGVG